MVQIYEENRRPSFAQSIMQGLTEGVAPAIQYYQKSQNESKANATAKELLGMDLSGFDPETRKALMVEGLKQQGKGKRSLDTQEFLTRLRGKKPSNTNEANEIDKMDALDKPFIPSQDEVMEGTLLDANLGRVLGHDRDVGLREDREERALKQKKLDQLRQETAPIKKDIMDRAELSREGIRNKQNLMNIIDRGDLDDPTFAAFASNLPFNLGKRLLSNDTVEYKGGLVDEFGDLKNIFKGATRVKEVEIYEDKLPDIYLTNAQKKAILKSRINSSKIDILREEAAQEVEDKFPELTALKFRSKVEELLQPKINALFNSTWGEQKAVIDQAEARKKLPLDPNDPDDLSIMQQIKKEAGGDKEKAKALAKKKGYSW